MTSRAWQPGRALHKMRTDATQTVVQGGHPCGSVLFPPRSALTTALSPCQSTPALFTPISEEEADRAAQQASLPSASSLGAGGGGGACGLKIQSVLLLEISIQKGASSKLRIFG